LVHIKETFLAHTIISIAKGKTLPNHHLDLKQLEQNINRYNNENSRGKRQRDFKGTSRRVNQGPIKIPQRNSQRINPHNQPLTPYPFMVQEFQDALACAFNLPKKLKTILVKKN